MHLCTGLLVASTAFLVVAATEFQCWNFKSNDDLRAKFYDTINSVRTKLARGNQPVNTSERCPEGKEMYRLSYDCALELEAQELVEKCTESVTAPGEKGLIIHNVTLTTCDPASIFPKTIRSWFNVIEPEQKPSCTKYTDEKLKDYATMAYAKATKMGCAQKNCAGTLYMACLTDQAPKKGDTLYAEGAACSNAKGCTTYAGSKCSNNLCVAGYIDPTATTTAAPDTTTTAPDTTTTAPDTTTTAPDTTTTAPDTTTTAPDTTTTAPDTTTAAPDTTTAAPDTTTAAVRTTTVAPTTTTPTQVGPNTMCSGNIGISNDDERNAFLSKHNELRSNLARGLVKNGKTNSYARRASKMNKLKYDCSAEKIAYNWASKCIDKQSPKEQRPGLVENRYVFNNMNINNPPLRASNRWFNEITTVGVVQDNGSNYFTFSLGITHFAKMAWDSATKMGCAVYKCSTYLHAVCEYDSPVKDNAQIYKMGPPCHRCPSGVSCSSGLCVV
ncbi:hypothetical protein RB195_013585 [Necator americanus]|uniref:SCP domain-containing protein n=1 Tax=Necator americanus TaxID=51031 RepID=A0ABR1DW75_NECAM